MKILNIILILMISIRVYPIELIPHSDSKLINPSELKGRSDYFLKYARNEIFARHGYIFTDKNLALYFNHQNWYKPEKKEIELSIVEKQNLEILHLLESNFKSSASKIVTHLSLNGYPIYYIVQDTDTLNFNWQTKQNYQCWDGYFYALKKSSLWTLKCESIPPEFIIKTADTSIRIRDAQELQNEQIKIINFSKACDVITEDEIQVDIYGPSNDPELYVLGFRNNKFQIIFHQGGSLKEYKCINSKNLEISMTIRHDIAGTMYRQQSYYLDLMSGKVTEPFYEVADITLNTEVLQNIKLYKSKEGANIQDKSEILGELIKGTKIIFKKYYQGNQPGAIYIESDILNGWINYGLVDSDHFLLQFAD